MSGRGHDEEALAVRPPGRLQPRRVVAIAVAGVLLAGSAGLAVAGLTGDDTGPSAHRVLRLLDAGTSVAAPPAGHLPALEPPGDEPGAGIVPSTSAGEPPGGRRRGELAAAGPADSIDGPGDEAVLPPPPTAATTVVPVDDVGPQTLDGFDDWRVADRDPGYVALTDGGVVVELFVVDAPSTDAAHVLTAFLDEQLAGAARATVTPAAPQPVLRGAFVSAAGAEYVAVLADQQATRTMSGVAIAATDGTGTAIIVTTSREGASGDVDLAGDAALLRDVIAQVGPA